MSVKEGLLAMHWMERLDHQDLRDPKVRKERMDFQEERENLDLKEAKVRKADSVPFVAMDLKVTKAMMAKMVEMVFQENQVHREE